MIATMLNDSVLGAHSREELRVLLRTPTLRPARSHHFRYVVSLLFSLPCYFSYDDTQRKLYYISGTSYVRREQLQSCSLFDDLNGLLIFCPPHKIAHFHLEIVSLTRASAGS